MNRGKGQVSFHAGGYTIVETLIFLAVSASMFIAAVLLIGGQTGRGQFTNSVRDLETYLQTVVGNVSSGYYDRPQNIECNNVSNVPVITAGANGVGSSADCIFLGTVIKFGSDETGVNREAYSQYSMAGVRSTGADDLDVTSLADAAPTPLADVPSVNKRFQFGGHVECVYVGSNPCVAGNAAIGFFTRLSDISGLNQGDVVRVDSLPFASVALGDDNSGTIAKITSTLNTAKSGSADYATLGINPEGGMKLCFVSSTSSQHALISIGSGSGNSLTITSEILGGNACP